MRWLVVSIAVAAAAVLGVRLLVGGLPPSVLALLGAGVVTGLCVRGRGHGLARALLSAVLAGGAAVALDWGMAEVLGAGHPEVRAVRDHIAYAPMLTLGFGLLAASKGSTGVGPGVRD